MSQIPGSAGYGAAEALGISSRRYYEDQAAQSDSTCADLPRLQGDPAGEWLRANDPRLRLDGVEAEIEDALARVDLSLDAARGAFRKSGGRPTAALVIVRQRVAEALAPIWHDDRRRDLMAATLGCDRKTLRRLMAKPPHVS